MGNKCDCYHTEQKIQYTYSQFTGQPIPHNIPVGVCWGTKECDECDCGGNRMRCDFYPEVRAQAKSEVTVQDAINHFKYGISHDIFSEPVTTYAEMAVEALDNKAPKIVIRDGYDDSDDVYCPCCKTYIGANEYVWDDFHNREWKPIYCQECGQAMIWE